VRGIAAALLAAMILFAPHIRAAPPNFQAAGTALSGNGDVSPAWPAHAVGDIALLFIESQGDEPATLSVPAGFAAVLNSPQATGTGGNSTQITVFWARATSTAMAAPTVLDPGNHVYAQILTYRGVITTGNPWDVTGGGVKAAASTSVTVTSVTTTVADTLVVQAVARGNNSAAAAFSAQTNANLTSITERSDAGTTAGGPAGGGGFGVWDGVKATAGATGNTTATVTSSINAFLTIALKPATPVTLSSASSLAFTVGDPPTLASTLTVTDSSTPTITAAGNIRIRIPATFNMTWDTTVTTVTLGGSALGKVNATLLAYEDSNRTAVLDVTSGFSASDQLTIAGLKFRNFTASSAADNLELVTAGAGGATADEDDKTITIVPGTIFSAGSRILNDDPARTPVAAEDTDVTNWPTSQKFLITIGIQTSLGTACDKWINANSLQWRNVTDAPGTWNNLGTAAGPAMILFNSANLVDNTALTQAEAQITGAGLWMNGAEMENNNLHIMQKTDKGDHTAIQLAIDPSGGTVGKTYQFRVLVFDTGVAGAPGGYCDAGSSVMSVSVTLGGSSAGGSAGSRILNDNAGRTPVAAEDVDVLNWDKGVRFLVTIGVQTSAGDLCDKIPGNNALQWRNVTDAPGTWNNLGTTAGPEMILFNSANLVDGNALTQAEAQIAGSGTWVDGREVENNRPHTFQTFANGQHSAIQFAINPVGGTDGKTYQFRFRVSDLCNFGSYIMSVSVTLGAQAVVIGGFNAYETSTAAGAITGNIRTKVAGASAGVDMIALNAARTAIQTTFAGTVRVEVLNASDNSAARDADGCRSTWTVIQTLSPDPAFALSDNGRKTISFTQANSYPNARLRISFPAGAPTTIGCSTDNFAIRPNTFTSFALSDTDWQSAGTGRALNSTTFAAVTHKAGRPLSARASAMNAVGVPTTNYDGTPNASPTACVGAACTASFGTLTLIPDFVAGQLSSDVASYDNVGSFRLQLVDADFANVDFTDGSTSAQREIASSVIDAGRFVPDHFAVALTTVPTLGTACGSFTYIGQPFNYTTAPVITVSAQDFANNGTTLYTGSWWRITNASLTGKAYTAATGSVDASGITGTDPAIVDTGLGAGTLTFRTPSFFTAGTGFFFTRTTPTAPASPYDADISLAINVIDADSVAYATNPARFGQATAGNGIAFNSGKQMRFGRLQLNNVFGSSLLDLPLPLSTQYYNGSFFVTNGADSCTTLAASDIAFNFIGPNLAACDTHLNPSGALAFTSGKASVQLTKPGNTKNGAVDLTVNLGASASGNTCTSTTSSAATTANKAWLQGDWGSGSYSDNTRGRATFGIYKNADQFLYLREVY